MKIGFSLSPGGLLLPYHLGALASLSHHGYLTDHTPLAGSSAGAIAVASHASGVDSLMALQAAKRVSSKSNPIFVASGGLLTSLRYELEHLLPRDAHHILNDRPGLVALAHRELFPRNRSVLQTRFETRNCLLDAVCDSSMFPYFLTNQPVRFVKRQGRILPRMVVDGVFACSAERIGCPDFNDINDIHEGGSLDYKSRREQRIRRSTRVSTTRQKEAAASTTLTTTQNSHPKTTTDIDRTVLISVFPTEFLSLTTYSKHDQIGPTLDDHNMIGQATRLVGMATQASTSAELQDLYQHGFADAETWAKGEDRRNRLEWIARHQEQRQEYNNLAP